ncbi:hypothetical protein B0H14DRAFT_3441961 [Mycena olivaceomarginata]|nr:hypothetical protein B0H14DRAFT_3441961 [Mycena olivaceomarginata]
MNGLWKLVTDAATQASALGAQAAGAVSPHANSALNAAKSVQISEEQIKAAKRAAEAVGQASVGAAGIYTARYELAHRPPHPWANLMALVAAGTALAPHANTAFNAIKSAAVDTGKVAAAVQQRIASLDPDVQRKVAFVAGGVFVGLVAPPLVLNVLGFTPGGVAAGSAAAGMHAGIGNVAAGSVFASLQSAGVVGLAPGACAAAAGLGDVHPLDHSTVNDIVVKVAQLADKMP